MPPKVNVESKVMDLTDEIFTQYGSTTQINEAGDQYILKDNMKDFIREIMVASGETDSWDEEAFEKAYLQFDKDGSGQIERNEFQDFIKRFADL